MAEASYRLRYRKTGPARFLSHLELSRALERAMRRAGLPLAFSQGYNPHPRLAFATALPVGVSSEGEYLDLTLRGEMPSCEVRERLNRELPAGLEVIAAVLLPPGSPALAPSVAAATYRLCLPLALPVTMDAIAGAVSSLLDSRSLTVTRETKSGTREVDLRPGILRLQGHLVEGEDRKLELEMVLATGPQLNIRPGEVAYALAKLGGLELAESGWQVERTALYVCRGAKLVEPLLPGQED